MNRFKILIFLTICACSPEIEHMDKSNFATIPTVLQERDPNYPLILSQTNVKPKTTVSVNGILSHNEYLGRSFHLTSYPYDDEMNLGYSVVDFTKVYNKGYISSHAINNSTIKYLSFSSYNQYVEKSKVTNTVTSGYEVDLGFFSIGHKDKMTDVFSNASVITSSQVGGEANIYIKSRLHELQYSSNIRNQIILYYLSDIFKDEVYNTPTHEFFRNYGGFVLKKFLTGGRATALYFGEVKESHLIAEKEHIMEESINAGIKYNKGDINASLKLEFGFNNNDGSFSEHKDKFSSLNYSVQTTGGIPIFPAFSSPKSAFDFNIDLSMWLSSLSDHANHVLIQILEGGLVPISDFILERNLVDRINVCLRDLESRNLCEPEICIHYPTDVWGVAPVSVYLHTRNNEYIFLEKVYSRPPAYISNLPNKYSQIFKTRIVTLTALPDNKYYYGDRRDTGFAGVPNPVVEYFYDGADFTNCKVFKAEDGTIYIIDPSVKKGYSIYKDYLLDTYAIRDFVNTLPVINISMESLLDYEILSL